FNYLICYKICSFLHICDLSFYSYFLVVLRHFIIINNFYFIIYIYIYIYAFHIRIFFPSKSNCQRTTHLILFFFLIVTSNTIKHTI
ncbi:MAG: hypothetical protein N7Q72_02410, partial [Spiroplasma sp. Tabriz.8]|nr:hypothetical protein [Spiroplasma sp. Tabriz.8]